MGPIFIVGCGRSGTTILRLILNRHSSIAIPEETWYFPQLFRDLPDLLARPDWRKSVAARILELNKNHFPDLSIDALAAVLRATERNDLPNIISAVNREFMLREGKVRWGDKTPGYVRHLQLIKDLFPEAKIIHVVRDGRDVVPSLLKYWSVGPQTNDFVETAFYWRKQVFSGMKDGPRIFGSDYVEVRYEDLVAQPEATVRLICDFIGEDFESKMLVPGNAERRFTPNWEWHSETTKDINSDNAFKWKGRLSYYKIFVIQLIGREILRKFSYELMKIFSVKAICDVLLHILRVERKQRVYRFKAFLYRLFKAPLFRG